MEYALLALGVPSNIEKEVRELQGSLYRRSGLISALALPTIIPLCFVEPAAVPAKRGKLRESLRSAVGREAPYLTSKSIVENGGFLFWELSPRQELQRLQRSCELVFVSSNAQQAGRPQAKQPDLFPPARGFYLCSLQGRPRSSIPSPRVSESLVFPAKAAFLLNIHILDADIATEKNASPTENRPWWGSLFWEKLETIPLRKSGAAR
jgi:hypothetical protein